MIVLLSLVLCAVIALLVLFLVLRQPRYLGRSIDDVTPYLVMVKEFMEDIDLYLDPRWQEELKEHPLYRLEIRRTLRILTEMFERKRQNVRVLNEFAETEYFDLQELSRVNTAKLRQLRAEHMRLQRDLEDAPKKNVLLDDRAGAFPDAIRQQLRECAEAIKDETMYCEWTHRRLETLREFISGSGTFVSAMRRPIVKMRFCNMIPYDKWTCIREPRLASFAYSRGIYLPGAYKSTKTECIDLINQLYPAAEVIRMEIQSQL
jgi:hypothetical protein